MERNRDTGDEPASPAPLADASGPACSRGGAPAGARGRAGGGAGPGPKGHGDQAAGDEAAATREPASPPAPAAAPHPVPAGPEPPLPPVGREGTRRLPVLPPAGDDALDPAERQVLAQVLLALQERGYDPARQLAHFLVTGEPAYITAHRGARVLAQKLDRVRVVEALVRAHLDPGA